MIFDDVMIDVETLGKGPNSVFPVLSAYRFDLKTGRVGDCFYRNIDVNDQIYNGRDVDGDTIAWWFRQGQTPRDELMKDGDLLSKVLEDFKCFINPTDKVWANGIDFDLAILRNAYQQKTPWEYWNQRDMRTVVKLSGINTKHIPFEGEKHCAKDDCIHQIKILHLSLVALGLANDE
jgi:hypothetical protein